MDCVNLRDQFGDTFRVTYEESYAADRGDRARAADPWLMIIPCRGGHIFPWGGRLLAFSFDRRAFRIAQRLLSAGCRMLQDGDDGQTLGFDLDIFPAVAEIVHPRRRRKLSEVQRRAAVERLASYQFRPQHNAGNRGAIALEPAPVGKESSDPTTRRNGNRGRFVAAGGEILAGGIEKRGVGGV